MESVELLSSMRLDRRSRSFEASVLPDLPGLSDASGSPALLDLPDPPVFIRLVRLARFVRRFAVRLLGFLLRLRRLLRLRGRLDPVRIRRVQIPDGSTNENGDDHDGRHDDHPNAARFALLRRWRQWAVRHGRRHSGRHGRRYDRRNDRSGLRRQHAGGCAVDHGAVSVAIHHGSVRRTAAGLRLQCQTAVSAESCVLIVVNAAGWTKHMPSSSFPNASLPVFQ